VIVIAKACSASEENVDQQRGNGVFDGVSLRFTSTERTTESEGSGLQPTLFTTCWAPSSAGNIRPKLSNQYTIELEKNFGLCPLFTMTNMPTVQLLTLVPSLVETYDQAWSCWIAISMPTRRKVLWRVSMHTKRGIRWQGGL
jgi:hypothetical protein